VFANNKQSTEVSLLMGFSDGSLGSLVGGQMALVIDELVARHGGVRGVVEHLQRQGFAGVVSSWVGTGANQPISPAQVREVFGNETVRDLASKAGLNPRIVALKLSQMLPLTIDRLTAGGRLPPK
jgi:uncharacterized protein YidB (DUF937 family)